MVNPPVQAHASPAAGCEPGGGCPQLFLRLLRASLPPPYLPPASCLSTVASCRKWGVTSWWSCGASGPDRSG